MSVSEKRNILVTTFNYESWQLATALEIINVETHKDNHVTWLDLNQSCGFKSRYLLSDNIDSLIKRKNIERKILNSNLVYLNQETLYSTKVIGLQLNTNPDVTERAKEIAYAELISESRDSSPCRKHNVNALRHYQRVFIETFNLMNQLFCNNFYDEVYIFNGRNLQERAAWDACISNSVSVNFYESFNENWTNRYFIFKEPTHSPKYRSEVMLKYSRMEKSKNATEYNGTANKWFIDRQIGLTQSYTQLQNNSGVNNFNKPYFVFFHSSQDELDMLGLISEYWKDQVNSLSALIDILKFDTKYHLILRIHPHLLHKSKIERFYWDEIGVSLEKQFSWFHYIPADSKINSYELMKNSHGIISCASTIGVEAAYLKKKSILLGRAFHEYMGVTQNPANKQELTRMLFSESNPDQIETAYEGALAYAFFSEKGGTFFKYVSYSLRLGRRVYKYQGFVISPLFFVRFIRFIEEFISDIVSSKKYRRCLSDCGINTRPRWQ